MIDYTPLFFIIFGLLSLSLLYGDYTDYKSRKVSVKTWWISVYIALPLSFIPLLNQWWDGVINVTNPIQTFFLIYPLFIIGFLYVISCWGKMGGADFIALTLILITSIPMGLDIGIIYMMIFIAFACISVVITVTLKKWKEFKIPLIIPISFAYFITIPLCLVFNFTLRGWTSGFI
jgi:hypothetical protein